MAGNSVLVMRCVDLTTLCRALRSRSVHLPYQAMMLPVRIVSMADSLNGTPVEVGEYPVHATSMLTDSKQDFSLK